MKKLIIPLVFLMILSLPFLSCEINERLVYTDKQALYFEDFNSQEKDSLVFSFTMTDQESETLMIKIKLQGRLLAEDKPFLLAVNPEKSTAVESVHYQPLEASYIFPANTNIMEIPITLLGSDVGLEENTMLLDIGFVENENFNLAFKDRVNARIMITNQLIKPYYWNFPLSWYFGDYSKVKHQKCIDIMGHDFPLESSDLAVLGYNYYMQKGRAVAKYFAENPTLDENGVLIEVWNPF